MERKQYTFDKGIISPLPTDLLNLAIQRVKKMAEIKIGLVLAYLIGVPMWVFAFITNLDSWKSAALFIVMLIYWMGMIWFKFRRSRRLERKEEMELRQQELDLMEREHEIIFKDKVNGK